jgi:hypothetical protein
MPIARYQLPDGRIARFEVPEGTTPEQAQQIGVEFFANQQAPAANEQMPESQPVVQEEAGIFQGLPPETVDAIKKKYPIYQGRPEPVGARTAAAEIERIRLQNPDMASLIESTFGPEAFLIGAGSGFNTLGRGIGLVDPADSAEKTAVGGLKSQSGSAVAGEIVGESAPFLIPGGAVANVASIPARVALGGALGASQGGIISSGQGGNADDIIRSAGVGLLFGAGTEAALPVFNRLARSIVKSRTGKDLAGDLITKEGAPTPEVTQALKEAGVTVDDVANQALQEVGTPAGNAAREKTFKDLGLTPTEAQRTRDTDLFVQQQDAFRRGGDVRTAIERQDEALNNLINKNTEATKGVAERAGATPIEAITDKALQIDDEINKLYAAARDTAPDAKNVKFLQASQALRENAPSNELSGGVVSALRSKMQAMGVIDDKFKPVGRVDVSTAEELRKYANRLSQSTNGEGRHIISQFKESLDDDVFRSSGEDFYNQARKAKAKFESGLDPARANKFDARSTSLVRDIRNQLVSEDDLINKTLNRASKYKARDLVELKNYLHSGDERQVAQGIQAWNDLRAAAFAKIKDKAFRGAITQTGNQSISRAGIESAFKEIGPNKIQVLFTPDEQRFIKQLREVALLKEPPPGTFTGSGPSSPAIQKLERTITAKIPVFGDMIEGLRDTMKANAQDKRVLTLIDDAEKIRKYNDRAAEIALRKSRASALAATLPAFGTASMANDKKATK